MGVERLELRGRELLEEAELQERHALAVEDAAPRVDGGGPVDRDVGVPLIALGLRVELLELLLPSFLASYPVRPVPLAVSGEGIVSVDMEIEHGRCGGSRQPRQLLPTGCQRRYGASRARQACVTHFAAV